MAFSKAVVQMTSSSQPPLGRGTDFVHHRGILGSHVSNLAHFPLIYVRGKTRGFREARSTFSENRRATGPWRGIEMERKSVRETALLLFTTTWAILMPVDGSASLNPGLITEQMVTNYAKRPAKPIAAPNLAWFTGPTMAIVLTLTRSNCISRKSPTWTMPAASHNSC